MQIDTSITRKLSFWTTILKSDSARQSITAGWTVVLTDLLLCNLRVDKSTGNPAQALDQQPWNSIIKIWAMNIIKLRRQY